MTSNINLLDTSHQEDILLIEPKNEVDNYIVDTEEKPLKNEAGNNIVDFNELQPENEVGNNIIDSKNIQPENEVGNDILDLEDIQTKNLLPSEFSNNCDEIQKECCKFCPLSIIM